MFIRSLVTLLLLASVAHADIVMPWRKPLPPYDPYGTEKAPVEPDSWSYMTAPPGTFAPLPVPPPIYTIPGNRLMPPPRLTPYPTIMPYYCR